MTRRIWRSKYLVFKTNVLVYGRFSTMLRRFLFRATHKVFLNELFSIWKKNSSFLLAMKMVWSIYSESVQCCAASNGMFHVSNHKIEVISFALCKWILEKEFGSTQFYYTNCTPYKLQWTTHQICLFLII